MLASDAFPANTTGHAAEAAALRLEAVMGQAIPRQNPEVVLRSHFNQLRALLGIALVAVAGLTVAVVILTNDSDEVRTTSIAVPAESAGSARFQAESVDRTFHQPGARYDVDPGIFGPPTLRYEGDPGIFGPPSTRFDGDPGIFGRPGSQTEFRGSKASEDGTPRFARAGSETQFRGSKASEDGTPRFARPGSERDSYGPASAVP
jgi:hypothetical protein